MLFYIGKDLLRWTEQCLDFVTREKKLMEAGIREQSFMALLTENLSPAMTAKLKTWGVHDQRAIFSRAIGVNMLFAKAPEMEALSPVFVQQYARFADYLFMAYQSMVPFKPLSPDRFLFELYASKEYADMLSETWKMA